MSAPSRPRTRSVSRLRRLRSLHVVTGVAVALAISLGLSPQAQAEPRLIHVGEGKASCPAGYTCVWEYDYFTGRGVGIFNDEPWWQNFPAEFRFIQNAGSSFYNNGRTSDVRF